MAIGKVFHLSYNAVNIIVWYMIIPLAWAAILDYKLHKMIEFELATQNVFHEDSLILSDNTKNLVARLLKNMQTTSRTNWTE